jgi:hypothetical protein
MDDQLHSAGQPQADQDSPSQTSMPQEERSDSQRHFVFVDSMAESTRSREAIRVHTMRESHRCRRVALGRSSSSAIRGELQIWDTGSSSRENASQISQPRRGSGQEYRKMVARRRRAALTPTIEFCSTEFKATLELARRQPERSKSHPPLITTAPMTVLGAGRRDPFAQYPAQQAEEVGLLVDHCKQ